MKLNGYQVVCEALIPKILGYQQGTNNFWYMRIFFNYNTETGDYSGVSTLAPKNHKIPSFVGPVYSKLPVGSKLIK